MFINTVNAARDPAMTDKWVAELHADLTKKWANLPEAARDKNVALLNQLDAEIQASKDNQSRKVQLLGALQNLTQQP